MSERRDEFELLAPSVAAVGDAARAIRIGERVLESEIEWRPRGVGALLDLGFDLLRSRFASCFLLATIIWLPWRYAMIVLTPRVNAFAADPREIFSSFASIWSVNITAWIAQSIVTAFIARLLFDAASGRDAGVFATLGLVLRRLPGLLVLGIVSFVLLVAALLACILPIVGMSWAVAPMMNAYVIEEIGIGAAVQRSFKLSFENLFSLPSFYAFWRWIGIVTVSSLWIMPLSGLVGAMELPPVRSWFFEQWNWTDETLTFASVLVGAILLGAATAVQAAIHTAYYLDLRVRRDGIDLTSWLARLREVNGHSIDRSANS